MARLVGSKSSGRPTSASYNSSSERTVASARAFVACNCVSAVMPFGFSPALDGYAQADIDEAIGARDAVDAFEHGALDRPTAQSRLDAAASKPWFTHYFRPS